MYFPNNHPGLMWGQGLFALLVFFVVVAAIAWLTFSVARSGVHLHGHPHAGATNPQPSQALTILNERFARGEIDAEEFTKRRDLLNGSS